MSTTTAQPLPTRQSRSWGAGRVVTLVCGSLLALVALGLVTAGIVLVLAHATARDATGFYTSPTERFTTSGFALTSEGMQIGDVRGDGAGWTLDALDATVRVRASAPDGAARLRRHRAEGRRGSLPGAQRAHRRQRRLGCPVHVPLGPARGPTPPAMPATQTFWAATASGSGTQSVTWRPSGGRWVVVVMNADAGRSVSADVSVGAKTDLVLPSGVLLLTFGALSLAARAASSGWPCAHHRDRAVAQRRARDPRHNHLEGVSALLQGPPRRAAQPRGCGS